MALLVLLAALAFAASPLLTGGFGGFDPEAFPVPQPDPPAQPAGWAFSIWGVIYLWLLVHAAFGVVARRGSEEWRPTRLPLAISLGVGAAWIPVAQASPVAATLLIWIMLVTALWAFLRAPVTDRWLAAAPIGLYAGWLAAASFVSLAVVAGGYGLVGEVPAAIMAILAALALAAGVLVRRGSLTVPIAVAWALFAIAMSSGVPAVTALALVGTLAALGAALRFRAAS